MTRRSPIFRYVLALLLVFAQQQAVVHAVEHEESGTSSWARSVPKDATGHPAELCAKCLALAHLHHASGVAEVHLAIASYTPPRAAQVRQTRTSSDVVLGYLSRAPPVLS